MLLPGLCRLAAEVDRVVPAALLNDVAGQTGGSSARPSKGMAPAARGLLSVLTAEACREEAGL